MGRSVRSPRRGLRGGRLPLKLLDVTEFYSPTGGGVRVYLETKARWLAENTDVGHVVAVPGSDDGRRTTDHGPTWYSVSGFRAPASPGYHILTNARRLREIILAEQPDVIEMGSHILAPWVLKRALRGLDIPVVGFLHTDVRGYYVEHGLRRATDGGRRAAGWLLKWYLRKAFDRCSTVIAPSEYARGVLTWAGIENTAVVPHGIETSDRRLGIGDRGPGLDETVRGVERPLALYAGRLSQEKGLGTVLRALPALHREISLHTVIVGDGHLRAELEAFASQNPHLLTVLPYERDRDALTRLHAAADVFLAPCPYETFGLAAVEPMAVGTPVVGAAGGAIGELIEQTGGGVSFRPGDPEALARALIESIRRHQELGERAREQVAERYGIDHTMPKLVAVYAKALRA